MIIFKNPKVTVSVKPENEDNNSVLILDHLPNEPQHLNNTGSHKYQHLVSSTKIRVSTAIAFVLIMVEGVIYCDRATDPSTALQSPYLFTVALKYFFSNIYFGGITASNLPTQHLNILSIHKCVLALISVR